jgi:hypothetical protein
MRDRADTLLDYTPPASAGRLQKLVRSVFSSPDAPGTLVVTLPQALDKTWQRDGTIVKPPVGLGQNSWWLTQTLALVPPTHWEERFKATPSQLIAAAAGTDSRLALYDAWSGAAILHKSTSWAVPLWNAWAAVKPEDRYYPSVRVEQLGALVTILPPHEVEKLALQVLKLPDLIGNSRERVLRALPTPWSITFANAFLEMVHQSPNAYGGYAWHDALMVAAHALPPAYFDRALALFTPADEQAIGWYIKPFLTAIQFRQRLYQEIKP